MDLSIATRLVLIAFLVENTCPKTERKATPFLFCFGWGKERDASGPQPIDDI